MVSWTRPGFYGCIGRLEQQDSRKNGWQITPSGCIANDLSFTASFARLLYPTLEFNVLEKKLYDSRIRYDTPAMMIISLPFNVPRYDFMAVPGKRAVSCSPSVTKT